VGGKAIQEEKRDWGIAGEWGSAYRSVAFDIKPSERGGACGGENATTVEEGRGPDGKAPREKELQIIAMAQNREKNKRGG